MDERGRIAMLARIFGRAGSSTRVERSRALATSPGAMNASAASEAGVVLGIGDDAAVLDATHALRQLVWTIDEQVDEIHFRRDLASWREIGWRSFMAAASDLAAMGARPWCALCALALPDDVDDAALAQITAGQREASDAVGAPVVGGNLTRGRELSIATTLLGSCDRAVSRAGARAGDTLWLAGEVGLAAAGLRALASGRPLDARLAPAIAAWRSPRALIDRGLAMAREAHAAIDVSDGLACDAAHLGEASGAQIVLDERAVVESLALGRVAEALGASALDLALYGGEDYALVVAAAAAPDSGFRRIGEVRSGEGLWLRGAAGERPIEPAGFDHFATSS